MNIVLNIKKVQSIRIPKALKKKWAKEGGVDNPEYVAWVIENWK